MGMELELALALELDFDLQVINQPRVTLVAQQEIRC